MKSRFAFTPHFLHTSVIAIFAKVVGTNESISAKYKTLTPTNTHSALTEAGSLSLNGTRKEHKRFIHNHAQTSLKTTLLTRTRLARSLTHSRPAYHSFANCDVLRAVVVVEVGRVVDSVVVCCFDRDLFARPVFVKIGLLNLPGGFVRARAVVVVLPKRA